MSAILIGTYVTSIFVAFWLACYVIFFQSRQLTIEETRQRLFQVRDRLFRLGVDGGIPFDSQAHERLRMTVNCSIRFAHDLSATRLVLGALLDSRRKDWRESTHAFLESNYIGLEGQALVDAKLIVRDTHYWLVVHTIKSSVTLCVLAFTYFLVHVLAEGISSFRHRTPTESQQSVAEIGDFGALVQGGGSVRECKTAYSADDDVDGEQRKLRAWLSEYVVPRVEEGGAFIPVEREAEECLAQAA